MSNGANGHSHHDGAPSSGQGLWILAIEGGIGYLVRTVEDVTEAEVAEAWATNGVVKFVARTVIVLDCVRGAIPNENRTAEAFALPFAQRLDARTGFPDEFTVHMTVHSPAFISEMTPANQAWIAAKIDQAEKFALEARAKRAGIAMPSAAR